MTNIATTVAAEINRHHELASLRASEAVHHAVEAGKLLLQVKAEMKHGQFLPWVEKHIAVTARQCQRYMAAAQGKPTAIRSEGNATPASHLPGAILSPTQDAVQARAVTKSEFVPDALQKWINQPAFCPAPGHWHTAVGEAGAYWVVSSLEYPTCFHISRLTTEDASGDSFFDGTRQPVPGFMVETYLETVFGLPDPLSLDWTSVQREGLRRPFGEPEVIAATGA